MITTHMLKQLKAHEGFRGKPYIDSTQHWSIGYGRNLYENPLTEQEGHILLLNILEPIEVELLERFPFVAELDSVRQAALLNMAYNLGVPRLRMFVRMWKALELHEWDQAAVEALDSRWARQVGARAGQIAWMLRTGEWPKDGGHG